MAFRDVVASAVMVALSLVLFLGTWEFSDVSGYMSPRVFPRFVAVLLFGFSAALMVRSLGEAGGLRGVAGGLPWRRRIDWRALWRDYGAFAMLVAASFIYVLILETIGYIASTILYLAVAVPLYGQRQWPVILVMPVVTGIGLYGVFRLVFDVPLPRFDLF